MLNQSFYAPKAENNTLYISGHSGSFHFSLFSTYFYFDSIKKRPIFNGIKYKNRLLVLVMHIPIKIKPLNHKNTNNSALEFKHNIVELLERTTMRYTHVYKQTITKVTSPQDKL